MHTHWAPLKVKQLNGTQPRSTVISTCALFDERMHSVRKKGLPFVSVSGNCSNDTWKLKKSGDSFFFFFFSCFVFVKSEYLLLSVEEMNRCRNPWLTNTNLNESHIFWQTYHLQYKHSSFICVLRGSVQLLITMFDWKQSAAPSSSTSNDTHTYTKKKIILSNHFTLTSCETRHFPESKWLLPLDGVNLTIGHITGL